MQKGGGAEGAKAPCIHFNKASNQRVKLKLSFLKFEILLNIFIKISIKKIIK